MAAPVAHEQKVPGDLKKWSWVSADYRRFIGMIGAKKFQV
jgi:hypothetical protein